jgi:hypothetical protein
VKGTYTVDTELFKNLRQGFVPLTVKSSAFAGGGAEDTEYSTAKAPAKTITTIAATTTTINFLFMLSPLSPIFFLARIRQV